MAANSSVDRLKTEAYQVINPLAVNGGVQVRSTYGGALLSYNNIIAGPHIVRDFFTYCTNLPTN